MSIQLASIFIAAFAAGLYVLVKVFLWRYGKRRPEIQPNKPWPRT